MRVKYRFPDSALQHVRNKIQKRKKQQQQKNSHYSKTTTKSTRWCKLNDQVLGLGIEGKGRRLHQVVVLLGEIRLGLLGRTKFLGTTFLSSTALGSTALGSSLFGGAFIGRTGETNK
jgi:hypothetical protein